MFFDESTLLLTTTLPQSWSGNGTASPDTGTPILSSPFFPVDTSTLLRRPQASVPLGDKDHGCLPPPLPATRAHRPRMVMRDPSHPSRRTTLIRPMPTHFRKPRKRMSTPHPQESSLVPSPTAFVRSLPRPPSSSPTPTCFTPSDRPCSPSRLRVICLPRTEISKFQDVYQIRRLPASRLVSSDTASSHIFWTRSRHLLHCGLRTVDIPPPPLPPFCFIPPPTLASGYLTTTTTFLTTCTWVLDQRLRERLALWICID